MKRPMGPVPMPTICGMMPVMDQLPGGKTTMMSPSAFQANVMPENAAMSPASREVTAAMRRPIPTVTVPPSAAVAALGATGFSFGRNL